MNDIVDRFNEASLERNELVGQFAAWSRNGSAFEDCPSPTSDAPQFQQSIYSKSKHIASIPSTPIDARNGERVACRRLQRQLNVQLQTSTTHIRDINALVSDMISSSSQCRLRTSPSITTLHLPQTSRRSFADSIQRRPETVDIDEGFHEDEDVFLEGLLTKEFVDEDKGESLRRASTPAGVRKNIGKENALRWGRSADVALVGGRTKIRSRPRMRKRSPPLPVLE